jgi:hypothetical protein
MDVSLLKQGQRDGFGKCDAPIRPGSARQWQEYV